MKRQEFEFLGSLNPAIAKRWGLDEHANKPIVIYKNVKQHVIERHLKEFGSVEKIDFIWTKLSTIIKKPDDVFYNKQTKGLEYYKKIGDTIIVAVRINFSNLLKIKSFYIAHTGKLESRRVKEEKMLEEGEIENIFF